MLSEEVSIQLRLKKTYIQVKRNSGELTYGGDQGFFKGAAPGSVDAKKNAMGCGVIAFCDLLLYLGNGNPDMVTAENRSYVNRVNKEEDYIAYYNGIYKFLGGVSMTGGEGKIYQVLVGSVIIAALNNGLIMLQVSEYIQIILKGIILMLAVIYDMMQRKRKKKVVIAG